MPTKTRHAILPLLILILMAASNTTQQQDTLARVEATYRAIVDAHLKGANTTALTMKLNQIIDQTLNRNKTTTQALQNLTTLAIQAQTLAAQAQQKEFWRNILTLAVIATTLATLSAAYYLLFRKEKLWEAWLTLRKDSKLAPRKKRAKRSSMILDDEVQAVLAAIIVVVIVFAAAQYITAGRVVEPFSELGLLGKNKKIGDYPTSLVVGEEATVYIYVGNHMGRPMLYRIEAKLGNKTTPVDPAPIKPFWTHYIALDHNQTTLIPFNFTIDRPGTHRLIVELWAYNQTTRAFQYHRRWVQLWINVTPLLKT